MTDQNDARVEVIQSDREAAADYAEITGQAILAFNLRHGRHDESPLIQHFARHRIASAATARGEAVKGWQPIETAPDKTWVIGLRAFRDEDPTANPAWVGQKYDLGEGRLIDWRTGRWVTCSHWMPLPAPPARDEGGL